MYVSWETTLRHDIPENAMVRITHVGRWDKAAQRQKNVFAVIQMAYERCSYPGCTATKEVHPLALDASRPHDFT